MPSLAELAARHRALSIIGMCKNAGKTTVLGALLGPPDKAGEGLALTSIGRDGESRDVVTDTPKPPVYIGRGALVATAEGLLPLCDATREILETTGIHTPMGEVVIFRALSDGYVQLGGPSMNSQLAWLRERFFALGARRVVIDGAAGRRSLCSRAVAEGTILCTGASYHRDMETVVGDTAHVCRLLRLPALEKGQAQRLPDVRCALLRPEGDVVVRESGDLPLWLRQMGGRGVLYIGGAVTDALPGSIAQAGIRPEGLTLAARDASKLLLSRRAMDSWTRRGGKMAVLDTVDLLAVTINPISAYGWRFDARAFLERMAEAAAVPVINVMGGYHA